MTEKVEIGDATLYHGDCMEILPTLDKAGAVVTDPPYGMAKNSGRRLHRYNDPNKSKGRIGGSRMAKTTKYGSTEWDCAPMSAEQWRVIRGASCGQVVWGANHLFDVLDKPPRAIVWDKKKKNGWVDDFSDCEFGWVSDIGPDRMFRHLWMGAIREGEKVSRKHPTQKPVELMEWCIRFFPDAHAITDPFMGSGTTGVACANLGRKFIGIEIERKYFDIACERIEAAYAQGRLFP